jgi:hypothetical protein
MLQPPWEARPVTMIQGAPGALAHTVLLTGLPPDAADAAVQQAVAGMGSSCPEELFLFKLPSGVCLGQGLVRLGDAAAARSLLSSDLKVGRRGGSCTQQLLLGQRQRCGWAPS